MNEYMNDSGYDSNGDVGPTRNAPGMEEDINVHENEGKNNVTRNFGLTDDMIDKMKVSEIKEALGARNLAKNFVKVVLI